MSSKVSELIEEMQGILSEKKAKLGTGARFASLVKKLKKKGKGEGMMGGSMMKMSEKYKVKNPKALAAYIGRKKYGKSKFQALSAKGRKHHHK